MSIRDPELQSVNPNPNSSGVVLRQPVDIAFVGPSLIDPRSFGEHTFAVYGPGDAVYDTGPGTILNSGIRDDPSRLLDGVVKRTRVPGTYELFLSGSSGFTTLSPSGNIGVSGKIVTARFTPSIALAANTQYEAVLVGDDLASGYLEGSGRYLGITSWTSAAEFTQSGTASSGTLDVITSYDRILPTVLYNSSTGYNDTYTITITSGSAVGAPKFVWQKQSTAGAYASEGAGIHDLGDNLTVQFDGNIVAGQVYTLDTYVPRALEDTYSWVFVTSELDASTPPTTPTPPAATLDDSSGGLLITESSETEDLQIIETWPENFEYAVIKDLPVIVLKFNQELDPYLVISGHITASDFPITISPLAGMPNITVNDSFYPSYLEVSGVYLKLWL